MNIRFEQPELLVSQLDVDAIAEEELRNIRSYLRRGRHLYGIGLSDLDDLFVFALRGWVAEMGCDAARRKKDDVVSEYAMRAYRPPYRLVREELKALAQMATGGGATSRKEIIGILWAATDVPTGLPI
jgi:hypothetical protein